MARSSSASASPSGETGTITLDVLARLLMLTPHRVNQLNREGWIPKVAPGRYRIAEAVQGYIRFLRDEQRRASKSASASRVQDARAREIELRTAREANRLIETEEAIAVCDEIVGAWRSALSGLPARITRDLELRRKIETEVDDICRSVSDRLAERARALRASGEAVEAEPEDDA